jgi:hypothetical protein
MMLRRQFLALLLTVFSFAGSAFCDEPNVLFDSSSGRLTISADSGTVQCAIEPTGFVTLSKDEWIASSDPQSPRYLSALKGVNGAAVRVISCAGRAEFSLNAWASSFPVEIEAQQIKLNSSARLSAPSITLKSRERIVLESGAELTAHDGPNGGTIALTSPIILCGGKLDVCGKTAGEIRFNATNVFSFGHLLADGERAGGRIAIEFSDIYTETAEAELSAQSVDGTGGRIEINGGEKGAYFSSGTYDLSGADGGSMRLSAQSVKLCAASILASGDVRGGSIVIGGAERSDSRMASSVLLNHATSISADARASGSGGKIIIWSSDATDVKAQLSARGGPDGGDGGFIEVSGKDKLGFDGVGDAAAPKGKRGTLLLDPKFIVIANSGTLPQNTFDNPDTGKADGDAFGNSAQSNNGVIPLNSGNVLILCPNDHTNGNLTGALRLYNGQTGALICSYLGSTANDRLGSSPDNSFGSPTVSSVKIVAGGNAVVPNAFWSSNKGAVTWINKNGFTSGAISSANSIVGSSAGDMGSPYPTYTIAVLNDGNYVIGMPSWNGGTGATTWVNGTTGQGVVANGTVNSTLSLTGGGTGQTIFVFPSTSKFVALGSNSATFCATPIQGTVTTANSLIGGGYKQIQLLPNGNYLVYVASSYVTWCSGTTGRVGTIDATNSLTGGVGVGGIIVLSNSNYVVASPDYNGNRGAVTWGSGTAGVVGVPDATNSVLGVTGNGGGFSADRVGAGAFSDFGGVIALRNGNYVVCSQNWNHNVGAVTWVNGSTGKTIDNQSTISAANSLVGTTPGVANDGNTGDRVGGSNSGNPVTDIGTIALGSHYVVCSPSWNNGKGAATWCNGSNGTTVGQITAANSLVGVTSDPNSFTPTGDHIGNNGVLALTVSGNYVIRSTMFDSQKGAVTWGSFSGGIVGTVSSANSLVGSVSGIPFSGGGDSVGNNFVVELTNGNYMVGSSQCNLGGTQRGAVTWGNGATGTSGVVSAANSIVGTSDNDNIGNSQPVLLANGNFVLASNNWHNGGISNAGAATWINGTNGQSMTGFGAITSANSVCGTIPGDGSISIVKLKTTANSNNNYLVVTSNWTNLSPGASTAGAVTFCNGTTGTAGFISSAISLVGTHGGDKIGFGSPDSGVLVLPTGNYVVGSYNWSDGVGAVTWGNGTTGITGPVSAANSVVGVSTTGNNSPYQHDNVGNFTLNQTDFFTGQPNPNANNPRVLSNGDYVLLSPNFKVGSNYSAGAATWCSGATGQTTTGFGPITAQNSLLGASQYTQLQRVFEDTANSSFIVTFTSELDGTKTSGIVRGSSSFGQSFRYAFKRSQTLTIPPSFIVNSLLAGTSVVLQANDDITVSDPITVSSPAGGTLVLQAGRSVLINGSITTNNSNLTLIANDTLANGVVNAERDAGAANITCGGGATITTGTGLLSMQIRSGAGITNANAGSITINGSGAIGSITTSGVSISGGNASFSGPTLVNSASAQFTTLNLGTQQLNVTGALSIAASGTLNTTLNGNSAGQYGNINLTGSMAFGAGALMTGNLAGGFNVTNGVPLVLITNDGADAITGTVNGVTDNNAITLGGKNFRLRYTGGDGNDMSIAATLNITTANNALFVGGQAGNFTIQASGTANSTISIQSSTPALPGTISFSPSGAANPSSATLSGTPTVAQVGTYNLVLKATATGGDLDAFQNFTLTVGAQPVFTSGTSTTFTSGSANSFNVTANGPPAPTITLVSSTPALPSGVTYSGGVLSGNPASGTSGNYALVFSANNGVGTAPTQNFTLTVVEPPSITSAASATFIVSQFGNFNVTKAGTNPVTLTASNVTLPTGVTYSNGVVSGTPAIGTQGGTYYIDFTASNGIGTNATQHFVLNVNEAPIITNANNASFTRTVAGNFTFTASGTPAPAITVTGTLPTGLTYNPGSGLLSGTVTGAAGIYPLTINASNSAGSATPQSFTLTVKQLAAITSANTSTYIVGDFSSFSVVATGSPAPTLSVSGTLPTGLTFVPGTGILSGTPAAGTAGNYNVTFTASNSAGPDATQNFTIVVNQKPGISSPDNIAFTTGTLSSFTVVPTGRPTPTITLGGATLPTGVTFSGNVLSGSPALDSNGVYNLTFTASSSAGPDYVQNFTLTVQQQPAITSGNAVTFQTSNPGSFTVTATGTPTPTFFTNSALPAGVTLTSAGVLSGTPQATTGGAYPLLIVAQNGVGVDATQNFTLTVEQPPSFAQTSTAFLTGVSNSYTLQVNGFPIPTVSLQSVLPAGLSYDGPTRVLSGTPPVNSNGVYNIVFRATNSVDTVDQNFTLNINQAPAITSANATTFIAGAPGSFTVNATGTPAPTFSTSSALPSGVSLSSGGVLSGTPAIGTGGVWPIVIVAGNGIGVNATQNFTLTVNQAPAITSGNSTTFTVGSTNSFAVTKTGFPAPTLSQSVILPAGVTFDPVSGILSGTPNVNTNGTYNLVFTANNGVGTAATQNFTLTVNQAPTFTSANTTTFTTAVNGSFNVTATGTPAPAFSTTGTLPSGVTLTGGGLLSGTPAAGTGGLYPLTLTAVNGVSPNASQSFTLVINQPPAITSANNATFIVGVPGNFSVVRTGFPVPILNQIGASLPAGVTFDAPSGVLSGTPAPGTAGTYNLVFESQNGVGLTVTQNFTLTVNQSPAITSPNSTIFAVGSLGNFTVTATGSPTPTLSISGATLPGTITFNPATGALSGTPTATGTYILVFTASNGVGSSAVQSFTLQINEAPVITSADNTIFSVGVNSSFAVLATGTPTPTISSTALPAGLTLDAAGVLSGIPAPGTVGVYNIVITATNSVTSVNQNFTLTINQKPAFTNIANTSFTVGDAGSFQVSAPGTPTPVLSRSGDNLPTGVSFDTASGVLSGTPAAGTVGTYNLIFTATNSSGVTTQNFTLVVNQRPAITSAASVAFPVGVFSSHTVTATGTPAPTITISGAVLPTGISYDQLSGVLSGTPAVGTVGDYNLSFTADNGVGQVTQVFVLTINTAAVITSASTTTFTVGTSGSFQITTVGSPTPTLSMSGSLPAGVAFNPLTGVISGTPAAGTAGTYSPVFTAQNGVGVDSVQPFTLIVNQAPFFTSANTISFTEGNTESFTVTASAAPAATITMTGTLPTGITFSSPVLSGVPAAGTSGSYNISFKASNGVGVDALQNFTLVINKAPNITSAASTTFRVGTAGNFVFAATGVPAPTFSITGPLPAGVSLTSDTLSGTPAAGTGGVYNFSVTASNGVGSDSVVNFVLTVEQTPAVTSANNVTFTVGSAGSFTVTRTGYPAATLSLTGTLPNGVTFNPATGVLSGTPAAGTANTYALTFTAQNGVGSPDNQSFTLTVNEVPAITSANTTTFVVGSSNTFTMSATGSPAPALNLSGALPSGVTFVAATGVLSGNPATGSGGSYPLTLTATNGVGSPASQNFVLVVNQPSSFTSAASAIFNEGAAGSFAVTTLGEPAPTLSQSGALPTGVTFNAGTGILGGTPAANTGGDYAIVFTASNGVGADAVQNFVLSVSRPSSITSANNATFTVGLAGSFTVTSSGFPAPSLSLSGTLPTGLNFNSGTGVLSGTPAAGTAATYNLIFTASNGVGSPATQNFTLTVNEAPAITSASAIAFTIGTADTFTVVRTGSPTPTLSLSGALPAGVTFNTGTGELSGTPAAGSDGDYTLLFTASNGVPVDAVQTFTLTVHATPVITWNNPQDIVYRTPLGAAQLNATANTAGTFTYTPALGTVLGAGANQTLQVSFTATDPTIQPNTITASVHINVEKASPVITWGDPADIQTNTPLSNLQLNATADLPGSFVYSPASGTVLATGNSQSLTATFTPADTVNFKTIVTVVHLNVTALAPVIQSQPTATPNPSTAGTPVSFTLGATDQVPASLGYAWDFGDGSTSILQSPTHTYTVLGTYNVTVTVTNGAKLSSSAAMTMIVMATGGAASTPFPIQPDTDGDGFPDVVEIAAGSSASSASETPYGIPVLPPQLLTDVKLSAKLNFVRPNLDSMTLSGTFGVPDGFVLAEQKLIMDVGGVVRVFTLNPKGFLHTRTDSLVLRARGLKARTAKFRIMLKNADIVPSFKPYGMTNTPVKHKIVMLPVRIYFNDAIYQTIQTESYDGAVGSGQARDGKR